MILLQREKMKKGLTIVTMSALLLGCVGTARGFTKDDTVKTPIIKHVKPIKKVKE